MSKDVGRQTQTAKSWGAAIGRWLGSYLAGQNDLEAQGDGPVLGQLPHAPGNQHLTIRHGLEHDLAEALAGLLVAYTVVKVRLGALLHYGLPAVIQGCHRIQVRLPQTQAARHTIVGWECNLHPLTLPGHASARPAGTLRLFGHLG
jgi:hypothetical protein